MAYQVNALLPITRNGFRGIKENLKKLAFLAGIRKGLDPLTPAPPPPLLADVAILCKILTDTLAKTSQNMFAYFFVSEQSKHFFFDN